MLILLEFCRIQFLETRFFLSIEVKDNPLICLYGKLGIKQNIVAFRPCQTQKVALKYVFLLWLKQSFPIYITYVIDLLVYTIITNIRYYCIF